MQSKTANAHLRAWGEKLRTTPFAPWLAFAIEGAQPLLEVFGAAFAGFRFLLSPWAGKETLDVLESVLTSEEARAEFLATISSPDGKK